MPESSSSTESLPDGHVLVGRIGKPHGLAGDVFVFPETDHPDRFAPGSAVWVEGIATSVERSRTADGRLIVGFEHVRDRRAAESSRGSIVTIPESERRRLEDDEWWPDDLIGLAVLDHEGSQRGTVVGTVEGVAQDRLVVEVGGARVEIPFVSELVPTVDLEAGHVQLGPIEGLLTEA